MASSSVKKAVAITWAMLVIAAASWSAPVAAAQYDVVVIGGTPAGIAAAIAVGRSGKRVMLVEQAPVLGGMNSSGVSRMDDGFAAANSGVYEEFRQRIKKYHLTALADDPVVKEHRTNPRRQWRRLWNTAEGQGFEPKTAARIYAEMVAEVPTITTRFNEVPVAATVKGERVVAVTTQERDNRGRLGAKHRYAGRVIIDATYEGDVAAFAGVPFRIGREARSPEEPHAGQIYTDAFCEAAPPALSGTIFPGSTGRSDDRTQAFTFRFVAKDYGRADHPYRLKAPPPGYDSTLYQWDSTLQPYLPNSKLDLLAINWGGDLARLSTRYVLADWEERAEIEQTYRNHALGWLYYIQTEGRLPQYGLADDEFTDNDNFPYRLYVRQGRRIEGLYTMTESDIHKDLRGNGLRAPLHPDSVAIGVFGVSVHNVQDPTDRSSPCYGEGASEGTLVLRVGPYQIPYGVMVPRNRKGLLVPIAVSSTHVAMSTIRMETHWSALGQAAGVAAALALDSRRELGEVPVAAIQDALVRQCSMLFFYKDQPCDAREFAAVQKLSLLGAVDSGASYQFHPDQPIDLGDFARLAVRGLQIPLSITAPHFEDVPREHPAFKYIETLYSYSTQSTQPFFSYHEQGRYPLPAQIFAFPDHALTGRRAAKILSGLLQKNVQAPEEPDRFLTRGEAALLVDQQIRLTASPLAR